MSIQASAVGILHDKFVFGRRARILSDWFAEFAPRGCRILDVGCGDGLISALLQSKRPDLSIQGIDVLARESTHIPVRKFDGTHMPFQDGFFDVVLFSDVLHHTEDPRILMREACRVADHVLIKDHYREGLAAYSRLRFMDWIGNARFGVALPYNYWTKAQWREAWRLMGLRTEQMSTQLGLYFPPVNWIFGAQLHFIALLGKNSLDSISRS